jgi:hypothetical protein
MDGAHDLTRVVAALCQRYPDVAPEVVAEHVRRALADLGPVTVRDYIPVLVERQARLTLADVRDPAAP